MESPQMKSGMNEIVQLGASIKDAGKKCFGISRIADEELISDLLNRLKTI